MIDIICINFKYQSKQKSFNSQWLGDVYLCIFQFQSFYYLISIIYRQHLSTQNLSYYLYMNFNSVAKEQKKGKHGV